LLGHSASLHSHAKPPPQFVGPKNATHFSFRAAKPSYTAGMYFEMLPVRKHAATIPIF
jgi:hypothetical protein